MYKVGGEMKKAKNIRGVFATGLALTLLASQLIATNAVADEFGMKYMARYTDVMVDNEKKMNNVEQVSCDKKPMRVSRVGIDAASDCYVLKTTASYNGHLPYHFEYASRMLNFKGNSYLVVWKTLVSTGYIINEIENGQSAFRQFPGRAHQSVYDVSQGERLKVSFTNRFRTADAKLHNHHDAQCKVAYGKGGRSTVIAAMTCSKGPVDQADFTELLKAVK